MAKKILVSIFIFCMLLSAAGNASAALFGTTGSGPYGEGPYESTLYEVDQTTGATTLIGNVGYLVSGMDYFDGTLYGVTSMNDPSFHGLITIDTATGEGTPVGTGWPQAIPVGTGWPPQEGDPDYTIVEMAIDSDGNAYGWIDIWTTRRDAGDDVIPIDLNLGTLGVSLNDGLKTQMIGLAFDLEDNLHLIYKSTKRPYYSGIGIVYSIATDTGAATSFWNLYEDPVFAAHHGDVDPATGVYWGLSTPSLGWNDWADFSDLLPIDLSTRTVLPLVRTDRILHTLAFIPEPPILYELKGTCKRGEWNLEVWVNDVVVDSFDCGEGDKIHETITLPTGPVELRSYGPDDMECGSYSSNEILKKLKFECEYNEKVKAKFELKRFELKRKKGKKGDDGDSDSD
jgi:hypothetical protein